MKLTRTKLLETLKNKKNDGNWTNIYRGDKCENCKFREECIGKKNKHLSLGESIKKIFFWLNYDLFFES
ncbi:hypothetical protein J4232_06290 [Candidatus Woesearchaeota archaeon]|nr:hypothetical protein [Candidatus Woesearchaeota archaeon]